MERSFGHPKPERKHEGVIVRIDEHSRIGQTLFVRGLDADSKYHIVPRKYGQLPGHVGKICPLKYLSFVAFFNAHQFDERAGQVRAPSVQVDGDRVFVEYGEIMVAFFSHAERPKINNLLARRTRKELEKETEAYWNIHGSSSKCSKVTAVIINGPKVTPKLLKQSLSSIISNSTSQR